jgi:hypothetical protein
VALNFGTSLFKGDPDDGLKARWQQSGSALVNAYAVNSGTFTVYTVTAGKTLYVDAIVLTFNATTNIAIYDNATTKLTVTSLIGTTVPFYFASPLMFSTTVVMTVASGSCNISISGWEE